MESSSVQIRCSVPSDRTALGDIHRSAFGSEQGEEIAALVEDLLEDETARPVLSLVAEVDGRCVGHILFTAAGLSAAVRIISARILAPLAVSREHQGQGLGGLLIRRGLKALTASGVDLVFVLGHPGYYPRFGFKPAGIRGFRAPHPIPSEHADAWMVQELRPGVIGSVAGRVECSDVLGQPRHWRE